MHRHKTHLDPKVLASIKNLNYEIEFLPANCTGRLQPLDIGINKVLKEIYTAKWENWFQDIVKDRNVTSKGNFSPPTKELCISWIWKSHKEITEETIRNSWNILYIRILMKLFQLVHS